jgi:hypothetical protein
MLLARHTAAAAAKILHRCVSVNGAVTSITHIMSSVDADSPHILEIRDRFHSLSIEPSKFDEIQLRPVWFTTHNNSAYE